VSILATNDYVTTEGPRTYHCTRCGMATGSTRPSVDGYCEDCRSVLRPLPKTSRPVPFILDGKESPCRSWAGDYDDEDRPLAKDGSRYMPGERRCGHSDCVNVDHVVGGSIGKAKLTESQVIELREDYQFGVKTPVLAARYGVSTQTVRFIATGKSYKQFGGPIAS
jgi:hypothetical protein